MANVIEARGLTKVFRAQGRTIEAVRQVDFNVAAGEVVGFLGPNGAGKTTTQRMLTTLLPIDRGEATVAGYSVAREPRQVRKRVGYVSQLGGADALMTGRANLLIQARLYGLSAAESRDRTASVLSSLDLDEIADRNVKTYSGGQKRRLDVALGIVHTPEVLFLDEPSTGLDPQNRANLWDHVRRLREGGTTVFLTTHYLDEADALCDRVMIMDHGEIVAEGTPQELKRHSLGDAVMLTVTLPSGEPGEAAAAAIPVLEAAPFVRTVVADGDDLRLFVEDGAANLPELLRLVAGAGIGVRTVSMHEPTLDDVFLAQTGRSLRDTAPEGAAAGGGR